MKKFASPVTVTAVIVLTLAAYSEAKADTKHLEIRSSKQCPDGLVIQTKTADGMIEFDVFANARAITNAGEPYKDRAAISANLTIATAKEKIASVNLYGRPDGDGVRYSFQIAESAAQTSSLHLHAGLYEKNGFQTLGGTVKMQVILGEFATEKTANPEEK